MRGSWLDFDFDHKDILYVRIDRRRKMPATILLKAMGMSKTEILDCFYKKEIYELEDDGRVSWHFNPELHRKEAAFADIVDKEGNVLVKAGQAHHQARVAPDGSRRRRKDRSGPRNAPRPVPCRRPGRQRHR